MVIDCEITDNLNRIRKLYNMKTVCETIYIKTNTRCEMINITKDVTDIASQSNITNGLLTVFTTHTTAGITVNQEADPDVTHDVLMTLEEILPKNRPGYKHNEGNSDAHMKSSLVGISETLIINNKKIITGTWQGIYFCEFDGPRNRNVIIQIIGL